MDVLVASSNLFRLELSAYVLAEAGYCVRECRDNSTLLKEVKDLPPALLVVDQQMMQTASDEPVHTFAREHRIPLLMLVTNASAASASTVDADGCVSWPYQPADLLAHVRALYPNP